jgi:hypothetical protein
MNNYTAAMMYLYDEIRDLEGEAQAKRITEEFIKRLKATKIPVNTSKENSVNTQDKKI